MTEDNKSTLKLIVISLVAILWIGCSIVAMIYAAMGRHVFMVPILVGQYLAGFGIIGFCIMLSERNRHWWFPMIFIVVGGAVFVAGFVAHFGNTVLRTALDNCIPYAGGIAFICFGLFSILFEKSEMKYYQEKCMHRVLAKCVAYSYRAHKGKLLKAPIYEVEMNGGVKKYQRSIYTNLANPLIGEVRELLVDYDDENWYLEPIADAARMKFTVILSCIFVVVGIVILLL